MTVKLKWNVDSLMLGKTKMAEIRVYGERCVYVLGHDDFTSGAYEEPEDCRQDAEAHVRRLLNKAGAPDA